MTSCILMFSLQFLVNKKMTSFADNTNLQLIIMTIIYCYSKYDLNSKLKQNITKVIIICNCSIDSMVMSSTTFNDL